MKIPLGITASLVVCEEPRYAALIKKQAKKTTNTDANGSLKEESEFTSIKARIDHLKNGTSSAFTALFTGNETNQITAGVPYHLIDYIELVNWTGLALRVDKRGSIDDSLPPIPDFKPKRVNDRCLFHYDFIFPMMGRMLSLKSGVSGLTGFTHYSLRDGRIALHHPE